MRFSAPSGQHDDSVIALALAVYGAVIHAESQEELAYGYIDGGDWSTGYGGGRESGWRRVI